MHIGVVAELTQMSIRAIRYYDQVRLATPSARTPGGFRLYNQNDVDRLTTIHRMKALNFTLDEMKQLLHSLETVSDNQGGSSAQREAKAFIAECVARAEDACIALRNQLNYAEEFKTLLATVNLTGGSSSS